MILGHTKAGRAEQRRLILAALPGFYDDIAAKSGVSKHTVKRHVKAMRAEPVPAKRECHVARWAKPDTTGKYRPFIAAGPGKDAACKFTPMTAKQMQDRHREKRRGTEREDIKRARDRNRHWEAKARRGDPLINALFGKTPSKGKNNATTQA
jgi:hypothetical protein